MIDTEEGFMKEVKKAVFLQAIKADGWEECMIGLNKGGSIDFDQRYKLVKKVVNLKTWLGQDSDFFCKKVGSEEKTTFSNVSKKLLQDYNQVRNTGKRKKKVTEKKSKKTVSNQPLGFPAVQRYHHRCFWC